MGEVYLELTVINDADPARNRDVQFLVDGNNLGSPVLAVRLGIDPDASSRVLSEVLAAVPVPVYPD